FTPYYFIAAKPGVYERQGYNGGGIVSYALKENRLYIGTAIDYTYHTSNRSVDPRSSVITYQLKFAPEIAWKTKTQTFGLAGIIGYGDERINTFYKNKDFEGTLLYPDRISYLNFGYGYLEINQTNF